MGILQAYAIYKYGKSRAEKKRAQEEEESLDVCDNCGWERFRHSPNGNCPEY